MLDCLMLWAPHQYPCKTHLYTQGLLFGETRFWLSAWDLLLAQRALGSPGKKLQIAGELMHLEQSLIKDKWQIGE